MPASRTPKHPLLPRVLLLDFLVFYRRLWKRKKIETKQGIYPFARSLRAEKDATQTWEESIEVSVPRTSDAHINISQEYFVSASTSFPSQHHPDKHYLFFDTFQLCTPAALIPLC
jgi:hypothetical protein